MAAVLDSILEDSREADAREQATRRGCACRKERTSRTGAEEPRSMVFASGCGPPGDGACSPPVEPRAARVSASATSSSRPTCDSLPGSGFPQARRIRKRGDYQAVYHGGVRLGAKHFTVFALATGSGLPSRIGLTVTRKIGNAAVRNHCKRLLREAVRKNWSLLPDGLDVVLHARRSLAKAHAQDVENEIVRVLPQAARRFE